MDNKYSYLLSPEIRKAIVQEISHYSEQLMNSGDWLTNWMDQDEKEDGDEKVPFEIALFGMKIKGNNYLIC